MPTDFPLTDPRLSHLQDSRAYYHATAPDGSGLLLHGSSALKRYREKPAKYFRWAGAKVALQWCRKGLGTAELRAQAETMLEEFEPSRYMNFGSVVDAYLFNQHADCRRLEQTEKTDTIVRARARVAALRSHRDIGPYVMSRTLVPQVAHAWQDNETGIWCRARFDALDYVDARPTYWDLKVWSACRPEMCHWNIRRFGVDIQAPLYRRAARDLWGISPRQGLLVAGPKIDDGMYLRWIQDEDIDEWDVRLSALLAKLKRAYETGDFSDDTDAVATLPRQEMMA